MGSVLLFRKSKNQDGAMKTLKKKVLAATMAAVALTASACSDNPRQPALQASDAHAIAVDISKARMTYVTAGGTMRGATSDGAGGYGFDSPGLISYIFAECCRMKVGDTVEEIYNNTFPVVPEGEEDEESEPQLVSGDLVFSKDKTEVAFVGRPSPVDGGFDGVTVILANRDSGKVEEIPYDKERFPLLRTFDYMKTNQLNRDYYDWEAENERASSPEVGGEFVDPQDPNAIRMNDN